MNVNKNIQMIILLTIIRAVFVYACVSVCVCVCSMRVKEIRSGSFCRLTSKGCAYTFSPSHTHFHITHTLSPSLSLSLLQLPPVLPFSFRPQQGLMTNNDCQPHFPSFFAIVVVAVAVVGVVVAAVVVIG
jgi:hypothetical protein